MCSNTNEKVQREGSKEKRRKKIMVFINFLKNVVKATLICLMLVTMFSRIDLIVLEAPPSPYFSIEATITDEPYWGFYGGYHDIWPLIQTELAKINITLTIEMAGTLPCLNGGSNHTQLNPGLHRWFLATKRLSKEASTFTLGTIRVLTLSC